MKCHCGFEADKSNFITLSSDKEYSTTFPLKDSFFKLIMPDKKSISYSRVFACPKCGALKIELPL